MKTLFKIYIVILIFSIGEDSFAQTPKGVTLWPASLAPTQQGCLNIHAKIDPASGNIGWFTGTFNLAAMAAQNGLDKMYDMEVAQLYDLQSFWMADSLYPMLQSGIINVDTVLVRIPYVTVGVNPGNIFVKLYSYDGGTNSPDKLLATSNPINIGNIKTGFGILTKFSFPGSVEVPDKFFTSVVLSQNPGDSLSVMSSYGNWTTGACVEFRHSSYYNIGFKQGADSGSFWTPIDSLVQFATDLYILPSIVLSNFSITQNHSDASCGNADGSAEVIVTGGAAPYTYLWSNAASTKDVSNIGAGKYFVTVTDSKGANGTAIVAINNSNGPSISYVKSNASDVGISDGNIKISISNGTAPYTIQWSNSETTNSISNLKGGQYSTTVTDASGCLSFLTVKIFETNYNPFYVYVDGSSPNCFSNGSLTAMAYGGSAPYTYLWNTTPSQMTQMATSLTSGVYSVTITDMDGRKGIGHFNLQSQCVNLVTGSIFNDANDNCLLDAGDSPLIDVYIVANDGNKSYYGYTDYTGKYSLEIPSSGTYHLSVEDYYHNNKCGNYSFCGNPSGTVTFSGVGDTSYASFGFHASLGYDLALHPGWSSSFPGSQKEYWVLYYNDSPIPFSGGSATVTFRYDSNLIYKSSLTPIPIHDIVNHTLTWVVTNVPYSCCDAAWYLRLRNYFEVPASLPLDYQLKNYFSIAPTSGDCDSSNNKLFLPERVTGSRDPNEKNVTPSGDITNSDETLTYTIHFQNTGNDTTHFIIVRDTLSSLLEPASVRNIASSHEYSEFNVTDQGTLTWIFNPIYLPDSATNPSASKGFVMFDIKKKGNLPIGTVIKNNASIYFDYNNPIVTNTVQNTISFPTGVKTHSAGNEISVSVFPNPFSSTTELVVSGVNGEFDFALYNVLGKKVKEMKHISSKHFILNGNEMEPGIYFYSIVDEGKAVVNGKVVVE